MHIIYGNMVRKRIMLFRSTLERLRVYFNTLAQEWVNTRSDSDGSTNFACLLSGVKSGQKTCPRTLSDHTMIAQGALGLFLEPLEHAVPVEEMATV